MSPGTGRRFWIALLAAATLAAVAWAALRITIEDRLTLAAQRDLQTIADLAATGLQRLAADRPGLTGRPLADAAAAQGSLLARSLERASSEHFRAIYFFDGSGQVIPGAAAAPAIVLRALDAARSTPPSEDGSLAEPYRNPDGHDVIGAWRWLPAAGLGVVAERPYDRFAQPLVWLDRVFAVLLAGLVGAAFFGSLGSPRALLAAFRRSDLHRCGPYRIERLIGEGAMSNVYLARHEKLGRRVALKRLKIQTQTDELAARFDREARLASRLNHPNIVTVLDHGPVPEGGYYYTMEFIDGLTLAQWVESHGPLPPARAVRLLQQICAAVGAMHAAGLLHRDIKPDNVMAYAAHGDYDLVKLLDFGLIKDLEARRTRDLTGSVRILGTPAYMAPERLLDPRSIDPRTDLYGIGCIAFFLLTGRKPFEAQADGDLTQQILRIEAPPVPGLSPFPVPDALAALVAACLAKPMDQRPASVAALGEALAVIALQVPWQRERARLWWESVFATQAAVGTTTSP